MTRLFAAAVAAAALTGSGGIRLHAELRPVAGAGPARGSFTASFPRSAARPRFLWTILFFDLTGPALSADLHVGSTGGVLFPLCRPCAVGRSGSTSLTQRSVRLIESGRTYVVVRTAMHPRGEIRGELLVRR